MVRYLCIARVYIICTLECKVIAQSHALDFASHAHGRYIHRPSRFSASNIDKMGGAGGEASTYIYIECSSSPGHSQFLNVAR